MYDVVVSPLSPCINIIKIIIIIMHRPTQPVHILCNIILFIVFNSYWSHYNTHFLGAQNTNLPNIPKETTYRF